MMMPHNVYSQARLYDVAFSYRKFSSEVSVIIEWFKSYSKTLNSSPLNALEIACGPARHSIALGKIGTVTTALDLEKDMCRYAKSLARRSHIELKVVQANMIEFEIAEKFDLVLMMLDSISHILSSDDLKKHLDHVIQHLRVGGIYILETAKFTNPDEPPVTLNCWNMQRRGTSVQTNWGLPSDKTKSGITQTSVEISASYRGKITEYKYIMPLRNWSSHELEEAFERTGRLIVESKFGDFNTNIKSDNPKAWRLIYVLRLIN